MARFLAVLNIFAGAASLGGLYVALRGPQDPSVAPLLSVMFVVVLALSIYVLLVPGTLFVRNVEAKIERFKRRGSQRKGSDVDLQKGYIRVKGAKRVTVEFPVPFAAPPDVRVVEVRASAESIPAVREVTEDFVVIGRSADSTDSRNRTYRWIAKGILLEPLP